MGDDRKAEYEMAPTEDPENPATPPEKADLENQDGGDSGEQEWSGLGKEELLRVADTPAWNWTRNILLVLFWIAWLIMLIVAIVLVVKAPGCPQVEWYEKSAIYQVFVPSFKDGDNDGTGDLTGLTEQLKQIKEEFGAETIVLSPIFKQARDNDTAFDYLGRGTVDFKAIDPMYGTEKIFEKLIQEAQVNGMDVVLEFVPNQSSDKHMWFVESSKADGGNYSDYYIWVAGDRDTRPNDWKNYKGEDAWTFSEGRQEWYYHYYESNQPDLNFNNEEVVKEIQDAMTFWLEEMDVDGFILVDADRLLEGPISASTSRRKRQLTEPGAAPTEPGMATSTNSTATEGTPMSDTGSTLEPTPESTPEPTPEPETTPEPTAGSNMSDGGYKPDMSSKGPVQYNVGSAGISEELDTLLGSLYQVVKDNSYLGKFRVFIPQHSGPITQNAYYHKEGWRGFPSSLQFANTINDEVDSHALYAQLSPLDEQGEEEEEPEKMWNSWMLGHAGVSRFASRAGANTKALMMLLYTLKGTPLPFYGDELGLMDTSAATTPQLMPYPWKDTPTGGFNSGNGSVDPWAPYADNLAEVNAETQAKTEGSILKYHQSLAMYHSEPSILAGRFTNLMSSGEVLSYVRSFPEWPAYLVVINLSGAKATNIEAYDTEMKGKVVLSASGLMMEEEVTPGNLDIGPNDAYLIMLTA